MAEASSTLPRTSIDPSDPLFLHSFDNLGMILVSKAFDELGFRSWKRVMEIAIVATSKLSFVNGKCEKYDSNSNDLQS